MSRMTEGRETWHRLLEWDRGQAPAERLAAIILHNEGFLNIDPVHPLGGRDGLKDMTLSYCGKKWIGGVYFPKGQQSFSVIEKKFIHDIEGVKTNNAQGFVFITNQELRLSERQILCEIDDNIDVQIYHLERVSSILNTPLNYGVRMEFLDIDMTKEEQLSFFSAYSQKMAKIENVLERLSVELEDYKAIYKSDNFDDEFDDKPRTMDEISFMANEFCEKIWFDRHLVLREKIEQNKETVDPKIWEGALASAEKMIKKYGEENLSPYSTFEWGMLNGKLSALRWVMGEDWDELYT